jgi:aspartate aminotransferase
VLADDAAVVDYLLKQGRVSSVPGAAYGLSPYFRISTATGEETLTEALNRIGAAVNALE